MDNWQKIVSEHFRAKLEAAKLGLADLQKRVLEAEERAEKAEEHEIETVTTMAVQLGEAEKEAREARAMLLKCSDHSGIADTRDDSGMLYLSQKSPELKAMLKQARAEREEEHNA